jgi:hypothetical protein
MFNDQKGESENRRAAAVDPNRHGPGDQRGIEQGQECDEKTEANERRHPANEDELHVHLRAGFAVRFVVVMRDDGPALCYRFGIGSRVFAGVLQFVKIIERSGTEAQEAHQQQDGSDAIHAKGFCNAPNCFASKLFLILFSHHDTRPNDFANDDLRAGRLKSCFAYHERDSLVGY